MAATLAQPPEPSGAQLLSLPAGRAQSIAYSVLYALFLLLFFGRLVAGVGERRFVFGALALLAAGEWARFRLVLSPLRQANSTPSPHRDFRAPV